MATGVAGGFLFFQICLRLVNLEGSIVQNKKKIHMEFQTWYFMFFCIVVVFHVARCQENSRFFNSLKLAIHQYFGVSTKCYHVAAISGTQGKNVTFQ